MAREGSPVDDSADDALSWTLETTDAADRVAGGLIDTDLDDGDESDGDFELETMEDDDEDDDDEVEEVREEDDDDKEEEEEDAHGIKEQNDAVTDELRDELMALAAAAADDALAAGGSDDTIAHRTRTKFSLVDVEMDSLESLLPPDPMDSALTGGENEYQRFLASLLPTGGDGDSLSFLDEEDEEYRPDDDDDDDDCDDNDRDEGHQRRRRRGADGDDTRVERRSSVEDDDDDDEDEGEDPQALRVSKRELTELLWDSTQVKVPPTFPRTSSSSTTYVPGTPTGNKLVASTTDDATGNGPSETASVDSVSETTVDDMKGAAAMKDLKGSVSPEQCIQLASQMHKHFQLLLQTFHMIATSTSVKVEPDADLHGSPPKERKAPLPVNKDQLDECAAMLQELQIRGKRALQHKAQILSKLTTGGSLSSAKAAANGERVEERRVTRSISAAHAAVAHPSMFDIVGSQSMQELTSAFERGCSVTERNQKLHKSMLEVDKHILLYRKKRRGKPNPRKLMFLGAEDRLLLYGVKRYGVEPDAWATIRETLIPTKEVAELSKRFRYLASRKKRDGGNEFKEFHIENNARKKGAWVIEEDVRIARGVVEYFGDNRRFARIASKYLPHRHRLEIRKRYERLKDRYRIEDGSVPEVKEVTKENTIDVVPDLEENLAIRAAARAFAVAVKRFLEAKLRKKLVDIPPTTAVPTTKKTASRGKIPSDGSKATTTARVKEQKAQPPPEATPTQTPDEASGCSVKNLHPALFFSSWAVIHPATLLERTCEHNWPAFISEKRKDHASESTLDLVSRAAASRVEEEAASHRVGQLAHNERLEPIDELLDEDRDEPTNSGLDFSLDTIESDDEDMDTGEEEESDFEREELLSSDADESDSEYERMELSDNDDDGDDFDDEESFDDDDLSHEEGDSRIDDTRTGSHISQGKHTLRLENLRHPGDTRAKRALEALERRITGNRPSVAGSTTGFTPLRLETSTFEPLDVNDVPFDDADLLAYEELSDSPSSDGEDEFEQDELHSSSDEDDVEPDHGGEAALVDRSKRSRDAGGVQPLKRPKLHSLVTRCGDCGGAPCVCTSARMRRLLDRIQPPQGIRDQAPGNL